MKEKIIKSLFLFFIFIFSIFSIYEYKKPIKCKILEVIEADEFIINTNKNKKIILKNTISFKTYNNYTQTQLAKNLNIEEKDLLKIGYLTKTWAKENMLGKEVFVYGLKNCSKNQVCKVDLFIGKQNYSNFLLKNGLGYINNSNKNARNFINTKQIKKNISKISELDFYIKNSNSNIIHKLNCPHAKEIQNVQLILKKELNLKNNIFCKKCLNAEQNKLVQKPNIPKSKNIYLKSFSKNYKNIDIYFINPLENKAPNKKSDSIFAKRLIKEINNSKETIDIALYEFGEQREIYNALLNAKNRGVKIRLVSDLSKDETQRQQIHFDFLKEFNGVLDKNTSLMHNKFFIFDDKLIMTGSVNISSTGSGGYNSNLAAFIKDEQLAQKYKKEFEQLYNSKFSNDKKLLNNLESDINVYFSPKDDIYNKVLLNLLNNAKKSIYVSAFYLTDRNFIESLIKAKQKGIEVLVLLDATGASNFKNRIENLRKNNIPTIIENWGGKNHEKTIAIDNKILIFGSCNFSKSGFYKNDENIIVIKNKEIASQYNDYFLYLFNSIDKKFLFLYPRAEGKDSINSCFDGVDNNYDGKIDSKDEACKSNI